MWPLLGIPLCAEGDGEKAGNILVSDLLWEFQQVAPPLGVFVSPSIKLGFEELQAGVSQAGTTWTHYP